MSISPLSHSSVKPKEGREVSKWQFGLQLVREQREEVTKGQRAAGKLRGALGVEALLKLGVGRGVGLVPKAPLLDLSRGKTIPRGLCFSSCLNSQPMSCHSYEVTEKREDSLPVTAPGEDHTGHNSKRPNARVRPRSERLWVPAKMQFQTETTGHPQGRPEPLPRL